MQKQIDPVIKEQFLSLPKKVQDLITMSGWQFKIREIVKRNNLRFDQGAEIENEVFLVMLGLSETGDFLNNIVRETKLDPATAQKVITDVSTQIFSPLKQALMEATESKNEASNVSMEQKISVKAPTPALAPTDKMIAEETEIQIIAPEQKEENVSESREEILSQIENPVKTDTRPIVNTISAPKISAPITPTQNPIKKIDPYREII